MLRMPTISFEFYPPKTDEQRAQLDRTAEKLKSHAPEYVSCTFGAGGSTLDYTPETIDRLHSAHGLDAAPHISCVGGTRAELGALLDRYKSMGCRRVVALRGDLPSGMGHPGEFRYASDLVEFIRREHDGFFHIEVGCYPETHPQSERRAGGPEVTSRPRSTPAPTARSPSTSTTPTPTSASSTTRARSASTSRSCPGIMPISNFSQLRRFSEACGAEIPRWIGKRMLGYGDDVDSIREFAADFVADLCRRLVEGGAPALHFYTLNLAKPTQAVLSRMGQGL